MATREEIREGIYALFSNCFTRGKLSGKNRDDWVSKYTNTLMSDLHSQGVVIKVDREFCPSITLLKEDWDESGKDVVIKALVDIRYQCAKAGYEATEPLIKEEK